MGGKGSSQEATGAELLYVVAGVLAILAVFYYYFHEPIVHFLFMVKYYELLLISHFSPSYAALIEWMKETATHTVTLQDLKFLSIDVGEPLKYPCAVVLGLMAVVLYLFHPDSSFRGIIDMRTLASKMRSAFPVIEVVSELDLAKESIDSGPWSMALTPIEFAKKHKLMYRDPETHRAMIDRTRAKTVLTEQLGPHWKDINSLAPHERAIFAALALYVNYKRDQADKLLEQIAASANPQAMASGKLNYKGVNEVIEQYGDSPVVKAVISRHAYKLGVFSALLYTGRLTGIVANATYLWLKPIDRRLWYTLNNVGRKAVFVETAAVHAHLLAERQLGQPIHSPMVDSAIDGLQEAIDIRIIRDLT